MMVRIHYVSALVLSLAVGNLNAVGDETKPAMAPNAQEVVSQENVTVEPGESLQPKSKQMLTGRLPRYFASLINEEQRQAIYRIQHSVRQEVDMLEQQLASLKRSEMTQIESVLTAAQREQLELLRSKTSSSSSSSVAAPSKSPVIGEEDKATPKAVAAQTDATK